MKEETKQTVSIIILTIIIVYYIVRLFAMLYLINDIHLTDEYIKARPVIEQGHLRAQQSRLKDEKDNKK
jgi:hypothetical protein